MTKRGLVIAAGDGGGTEIQDKEERLSMAPRSSVVLNPKMGLPRLFGLGSSWEWNLKTIKICRSLKPLCFVPSLSSHALLLWRGDVVCAYALADPDKQPWWLGQPPDLSPWSAAEIRQGPWLGPAGHPERARNGCEMDGSVDTAIRRSVHGP